MTGRPNLDAAILARHTGMRAVKTAAGDQEPAGGGPVQLGRFLRCIERDIGP